jgi:hypothetical protein
MFDITAAVNNVTICPPPEFFERMSNAIPNKVDVRSVPPAAIVVTLKRDAGAVLLVILQQHPRCRFIG